MSFAKLPGEVRQQIYDLVFQSEETYAAAFKTHPNRGMDPSLTCTLDPNYRPSHFLRPLLVSKQWHQDATLFAFSRTFFVVQNPYTCLDIQSHVRASLSPSHIAAIRHLAVVADARHFRQLRYWKTHAFGMPELRLTDLRIILHRSSYWHYLFDFNSALVALLRELRHVDRLSFVRNGAMVKGSMLTWYNGLVRLILKRDAMERFEPLEAKIENSWWEWRFAEDEQTVCLELRRPKVAGMCREVYEELMLPLYEALKVSMEGEEWDPDPFSRVSA